MKEGTSGMTGARSIPPQTVECGGSDPPDPDGIAVINRHAIAAAKTSATTHGPFPARYDFNDIIQKVHLHLLERFGNGYANQIAEAERSKDFACVAFQELRAAVKQAVGECRWTDDQRNRRGRKQVPITDTDGSSDDSAVRDLAIDLSAAMLCLSSQERKVLALKKDGYTGDEIAQLMELRDKRDVSAIFRQASKKIIASRKEFM